MKRISCRCGARLVVFSSPCFPQSLLFFSLFIPPTTASPPFLSRTCYVLHFRQGVRWFNDGLMYTYQVEMRALQFGNTPGDGEQQSSILRCCPPALSRLLFHLP